MEEVRYGGENTAAEAVRRNSWLAEGVAAAEARDAADPDRIKRALMARSVRLTEGMAPAAFRAAQAAADALGVTSPFEIYQAAGAENAAIHLVHSPALLEVRGRMLTLLGDGESMALFGHELGHYLAHGPAHVDAALGLVSHWILSDPHVPEHAVTAVRRLSMAREITADRFGLLAAGSLESALRLELVATTGLSVSVLAFDIETYLDQCRALVAETERDGDGARGHTHPEHGVRAWALWLYSETDSYQRLTGRGPGTRSIAEVDKQIATVMEGTEPDELVEGVQALEPLPEVHECALACAVMVALADDHLHEEEALALERAFAPLVGDWQRYLSWDNAHEAFVDTGSVIVRGGARLQKGVFHIILQVALADGELSEREIHMIGAIGDALGCGTLFRALLTPVLDRLGLELPDPDANLGLRMPPRADEADAALGATLDGVVRRKGGRISLRRLCRLLGDMEGSETSRDRVGAELLSRGITADPFLADAELDRPLDLTVVEAVEVAPPVADDADAPARQRLIVALSRLRDQLVSGDGRSPSIRLRLCRTGRSVDMASLESMSVGHADRALALIANGQAARLVDGKEIGMHEGADALSRELLALEREALSRFEETGARDLYVGEPFLTGVFHGYLVRAPMILHPVDLERTDGRGYRLVPRPDSTPTCNQALVRLLFAKRGVPFPDELGDILDEAAAEGVEAMREALSQQGILVRPESEERVPLRRRDEAFATWPDGRVVVERASVLGFFPQSASDLIQDYDRILDRLQTSTENLGDALGAAGPLLPAELRELLGVDSEVELQLGPIVPVVPADPSQLAVVQASRATRTLVVDGPPGTGKSQVIVNLVTDAIARGQTVAVVCEKRAAIDVVVQRLEQVGLRHLLAVVHDVNLDRRGLYDQIERRLGESMLRDHDEPRSKLMSEEANQVTEVLRRLRGSLATALAEQLPSLGQLHLLASSFSGPPLQALDPTLHRLDHRQIRALGMRVGREAVHGDLYGPDSVWRPPAGGRRPSLAEASPETLMAVEEALRGADEPATAFQTVAVSDVDEDALLDGVTALRIAIGTRDQRATDAAKGALVAWLHRNGEPGLDGLADKAAAAWADRGWVTDVDERVTFQPSPELEQALTVVEARGGSWLRWFSWAWWSARSTLRTVFTAQWPAALTAPIAPALVGRVRARQAGAAAWKSLDQLLVALRLSPGLADTTAAAAWVDVLFQARLVACRLLPIRPALQLLNAWPDEDFTAWDGRLDRLMAHHDALLVLRDATEPLRTWAPWLPRAPSPETVTAWFEAWAIDAQRVATRDRNLDVATQNHPSARKLVHALAEMLPDGGEGDWSDALEHGWALQGIAALQRHHPQVRDLDRVTPYGEVVEAESRLAEAMTELGELQVQAIAARADRIELLTAERPEKGKRRTPVQKARETLLREASKRRYVLSLRAFVRNFTSDGLTDLLPVWLLSPETMAVLFPPEPVFDLVVMDEASQCTVEKGFPALLRGRRAVVAGDEKQMPPSRFFELSASDDDEVVSADAVLARDALTAESLLVLARQRCVHTGLRWHYRCVREELIAFSNHAMYGGDLFTIPSTATRKAPPAVEWVSVPDGAYDKGANPIEADRVVDRMAELLADDVPMSIGVVTFNVQQRRVVLDRIDARVEADPEFAERWAAASTDPILDQRPFVKNLESVQGDERDVIVFSLGHAPTLRASGPLKGQPYVPARFGPLGQAGGERRLNVAVSRAKRRCIVVSSFEPSMLTVVNSKHEGPRLLKAFLELIWDLSHGRLLQADKTLERVRQGGLGTAREPKRKALPVAGLAAQIGEVLSTKGVFYDLDVGNSGFRVPLAVHGGGTGERYVLAVLTDDGSIEQDVKEAHVHHPAVLGFRGWRCIRVTSRQWHLDPDGVLDRIEVALANAATPPTPEPSRPVAT